MPVRSFGQDDLLILSMDDTVAVNVTEKYITLRAHNSNPVTQVIETSADGSDTDFSVTLSKTARAGSLEVWVDNQRVATDDGEGFLVGDSPSDLVPGSPGGSIDYLTGELEVSFASAPAASSAIYVRFISLEPRAALGSSRYAKGDVIFPNFTGDGLGELFGFDEESSQRYLSTAVGISPHGETVTVPTLTAEGRVTRDTQILYQVSTDGGTTWQYYDSLTSPAWAVGDDTDATFSTAQEIARGISQLAWTASSSARQFRLKARLLPSSDSKWAPILRAANLYFEYILFDLEDDFKRSLKRHIKDNLVVREVIRFNVTSATAVTLDVDEQSTDLTYSNVLAFNLTDNPGRTVELSTTLVDDVLTFATAQTGLIEVLVDVSVPVFIRSGPFTQLSTTRAVVLDVGGFTTLAEYEGDPRVDLSSSLFERPLRREPVGYPVELFRVRDCPSMMMCSVDIACQSKRERQATAMVSAIRKMFGQSSTFPSVQSGDLYVRTTGEKNDANSATAAMTSTETDDVSLGIAIKVQSMTFAGWAQDSPYATVHRAQVVHVTVGSSQDYDPTVLGDPADFLETFQVDEDGLRPSDLDSE